MTKEMQSVNVENLIVIITGGGASIGLATARAFAQHYPGGSTRGP